MPAIIKYKISGIRRYSSNTIASAGDEICCAAVIRLTQLKYLKLIRSDARPVAGAAAHRR